MGTVSIYPTSNTYVVSFSARKVYIPCGATLKFVDSLLNEKKTLLCQTLIYSYVVH